MPKSPPTLSALFTPEPRQWGLRGDPYLWREMAGVFEGLALPATDAEFDALLRDTYRQLVGVVFDSGEVATFVPRYHHHGMSSGHVSLAYWRDTGFPLLRKRFIEAGEERGDDRRSP